MKNSGRTGRNRAGSREFLRGEGLAACTTALGLAECPRETLRDRLLASRSTQ
jgi:hypothetical protein